MATAVSQPVRIVALLGLAAALAIGGMFMLLGRKSTSVGAPVVPRHHRLHTTIPTRTQAVTPTTRATAKPTQVVKTTPSTPKVPAKPAAEIAALRAGLPAQLARALGQHAVVVVELTDPQAEVDGIAFAEAQAGAALAGAGFVSLNVLSRADVGKLTELLGQVLPDPGLLVYRRPARLVVRIDGFVDRDTAAQAALNAG